MDEDRAPRLVERIDRARRVVSHCSQAAIRAYDEEALLSEACRHLVDVGGYRMAWFAESIQGKGGFDVDGTVGTTPASLSLAPGTYNVTEATPLQSNWVATTPIRVTASVVSDGLTSVAFGNVCLGPPPGGSGHTIGYWQSKHGVASITASDLALLRGLHLRNPNGSDFDPTTAGQVASWLKAATATNMASMLSAQLAAAQLNVAHGYVSGSLMIHAPGTVAANAAGFATLASVMAEAEAALTLDGLTRSGDPNRAAQTILKDALDQANQGRTFVQASPCVFTFG
jgi:hypothetical protein